MGTRGIMAFKANGEVKAAYNHWDSYPSGLGLDIVKWLRSEDFDPQEAWEKAGALVAVDEDEEPSEDQMLSLMRYYDPGVSSGKDWYSLLHGAQGDPQKTLDSGFYIEGFDFGYDSLYCEWAYVIDLDESVLEVYKGFNNQEVTEGWWLTKDRISKGIENFKDYEPVRPIRWFAFGDVTEEVMDTLEEEVSDD